MEKQLIPLSLFGKVQNAVEVAYYHANLQVKVSPIFITFILYLFITSVGFDDILPGDEKIFTSGTQMYTILEFVRAIYRPFVLTKIMSNIIFLFYTVFLLYIIVYIPVLVGSFQLRVTGHINNYFCYYIVVSCVFIVRYICLSFPSFIATAIYFLSTDENARKNINVYIIIIISSIILIFQEFYIEAAINTNISYKKGTSWGWLPKDQTKCIIFIYVHAFLSRMAELYPFGVVKYIFSGLTLLFTILFIVSSYISPTLIDTNVTALFIGSSMSGIICLVLTLISHQFINFTCDEVVTIFVVATSFFGFLNLILLRRRNNIYNALIDEYSSANCEISEVFKTPKKFLQAMRVGFSTGNPNLINWFIIKDAIKEWPENQEILKQYLMFLTAFVVDSKEFDETVLLLKTVNPNLPLLIYQATRITESRSKTIDVTQCSELKRINKATNQLSIVVNCYWATLLSGNTTKSFTLAKDAIIASKLINELYNGCVDRYPNCSQICKLFAKFHETYTGDNNAIVSNCQKANILANSKYILTDKTEKDMHNFFPMLPEKNQIVSSTKIDDKADELSVESSHSNLSASGSIASIAEVTSPDTSGAFDKGIPIPAVNRSLIVVWACFVIFFVAGSVGPCVYMLHQHDVLAKGVLSAEYGSKIPVQLTRLALCAAIRAMEQSGLIESERAVLGAKEGITYRELMLQDLPEAIEALDSLRLDSIQDSGFGSSVYSFLNQEIVLFKDGSLQYNITAMELINTLYSGLLEVAASGSDDDLFENNGFKLSLYNVGLIGSVMDQYVSRMIEGISVIVDDTDTTITTITIIVLIVGLIFAALLIVSIVGLYRFYVHVTRCLLSIPKSAFLPIFPALESDVSKNQNNSKLKNGKTHDNSNLSAAHSENSFPIKQMIFSQVVFFFVAFAIHIMMFVAGIKSIKDTRNGPMNVLRSASLMTGMNVAGVHLLQCIALTQSEQVTGYDMATTAAQIEYISEANRKSLSDMLMGVDETSGIEYGTFMYDNKIMNAPLNGTFEVSNDIHKILASAPPLVSLSTLITTSSEVGRRASLPSPSFGKDDYSIALYYHMMGRHLHNDFYSLYLSSASADVGESQLAENANYVFMLVCELVVGFVFVLLTHKNVMLVKVVVNHMISLLRFLKKDEVLACDPIANLLAGTSQTNGSEKDLSMVASVDSCSSTAAFVVDKHFVVEWCNEAAGRMLGVQHTKLFQDRISTHAKFSCERLSHVLAGKESLDGGNYETETFETDMDVFGVVRRGITASITPADGRIVLTLSSKDEVVAKQQAIEEETQKIQKILDYVIPKRLQQKLGEKTAGVFENVVVACFRASAVQRPMSASAAAEPQSEPKSKSDEAEKTEEEEEKEEAQDEVEKAPEKDPVEEQLKDREAFIDVILSKLPEDASPISRVGNAQYVAFNIDGKRSLQETVNGLVRAASEARRALLEKSADLSVAACCERFAVLGRVSAASTAFNVFAPGVSTLMCTAAACKPGCVAVDDQCHSSIDEKKREQLSFTRFHNMWAFNIDVITN